MPSNNYNNDKGALSIEGFLESLKNSVGEGDKIENEEQLRLAWGRQKMAHREKRLEAELEKSKNQIKELEIDQNLKITVEKKVFRLLHIETYLLFFILFLQGFNVFSFRINDTTLNIFAPVTILQISSMAIIIARYLFPPKK